MKTILVVGPSVTAEKNGYVEIANDDPRKPSHVKFRKVGLGGMFPQQIKYIFAALLEEHRPDLVVLEFATAPSRRGDNPAGRAEAMNWMIQACCNKGLPTGILDFPRIDMEPESDWVYVLHEKMALSRNCSYKSVGLQPELLADAVHPTLDGRRVYADALLGLTVDLLGTSVPVSMPDLPKAFGCIRSKDALSETVFCEDFYFERAGFGANFILLHEGQSQSFDLPQGTEVSGLSFVMGPTSGFLLLKSASEERRICTYDQYCYYKRMGMASFSPIASNQLTATVLPDYPDVELLKGVKDTGPRQAIIGLFLTEQNLDS